MTTGNDACLVLFLFLRLVGKLKHEALTTILTRYTTSQRIAAAVGAAVVAAAVPPRSLQPAEMLSVLARNQPQHYMLIYLLWLGALRSCAVQH